MSEQQVGQNVAQLRLRALLSFKLPSIDENIGGFLRGKINVSFTSFYGLVRHHRVSLDVFAPWSSQWQNSESQLAHRSTSAEKYFPLALTFILFFPNSFF